MLKKFVKDYLTFTKKDRVGVLVLLALIFVVVLLPYIWPAKKIQPPSPQEIERLKLLSAQLNKMESATVSTERRPVEIERSGIETKSNDNKTSYALFYFDPNTIGADAWRKLGIREKTIGTILHYQSKGGKFRQPEDIKRIYGLSNNDYERLLPFVKIAGQRSVENKYKQNEFTAVSKTVYPVRSVAAPKLVEINTADTTALIALPGIGSKLAARIINFRGKLGGFYAVEQVAETYGLPDSTFAKIQSLLRCTQPAVLKLNINTADGNTLKQHPYIRWNLANAIVQFRAQHGSFKSVEDLQQIALVTPELFQKIKAYVVVE